MDKHTLEKLEFEKIRSHIRGHCHTPLGIIKAEALFPKADSELIKKELDETFELTEILRYEEPFAIQTLDDIDIYLSKLRIAQTFLEPSAYLKVTHFLHVTQALRNYIRNKTEKYPLISGYLSELQPAPEIIAKVEKAIDKTGEIKDSASAELRRIRIEKQLVRNKILSRLEGMIHDRPALGSRQDDLITIRDDRYVIPVAASEFSSKSGVIHGRSKSGVTFFIEPMETVELNNQLRSLTLEEEAEIERILIDIGDSIRLKMAALENNYQIIGQIDFIHAKARLAVQLDCQRPDLVDDPLFDLINARHPLLMITSKNPSEVVPMSLHLGKKYDCLVITGPNMGGKTVALKTVGLFALMVQSGMLIPVDQGSTMGIFEHIFADIGDEQSIELSLSTFSSHISQIIRAIKMCDSRSLILIDELGAGTDPVEGSALGEAILMEILSRRGKAIVTTHYSALKTLPEKDQRIQNASLEFDRQTLQPSYRLMIGLPGSSYAIEMAKRLGMPEEIVANALNLMGTQERELTVLLERLQRETRAAEIERREMAEAKASAQELEKRYQERAEKLAAEEKLQKERAIRESQQLIESTRSELEHLVKSIRETRADKISIKDAHDYIKHKQAEIRKQLGQEKSSEPVEQARLSAGDRVFVENLQAEGELLDYNANTKCWRIRTGSIIATAKAELLKKLDQDQAAPRLPKGVNYAPFSETPIQISVMGMTALEAVEAVEKYLDSVSLTTLETVYILHGKGTGALRKAVSEYLRKHPLVKEFRLGYFNEGSSGVTVVTLKH